MGHLQTIHVSENSPHRIGIVESDKRDKSRKVSIDYSEKHPKYGKYRRRSIKLQVHDPLNTSRVGDRVEIAECRPISKTKSWVLVRVVQAGAVQAQPDHSKEG